MMPGYHGQGLGTTLHTIREFTEAERFLFVADA